MRAALWYSRKELQTDIALEDVPSLLADHAGLLWLDIQDPGPDDAALLSRLFHFHPLALEDLVKRRQRPKIDHYEGYDFVVLYHAMLNHHHRTKLTQVSCFIGSNYVVTAHDGAIDAITNLRQRWLQQPTMVEPHPMGFLLYNLTDGLVDSFFPVIDTFGRRIDALEEELFVRPGPPTLQHLLALRRELIGLRRVIGAERDVFNALSRRDQPFFHESTAVFFTDVYDHILRLTDTLDIYREMLTVAVDAYLSQQSNRLNVVVKQLTAITLVLMLVTLVTGFCGMNVQFPGRDDPFGLIFALAAMAALGVGAWLIARQLDWL